MQDTSAEKREKDFMITQRIRTSHTKRLQKTGAAFLLWLLTTQFIACTPDLSDAAIPHIPFSAITLNLNLPENVGLRTDGGLRTLSSSEGGVQGIVIYRQNMSTYIAYERNCSYHPNDACVTVEVHSSRLYMQDPCCASTFSLATGEPTGGPAWRPLRKYETLLTGSNLTITDTIVE
jgi:nitrite reductase/ring-hydroxylating ferredoxin subunit